jgi:hypothetical protein
VLYHNNYWSILFGQKYDPLVFEVSQLPKYFGDFIIFIFHSIANSPKHRSLAVATLIQTMLMVFKQTAPFLKVLFSGRDDNVATIANRGYHSGQFGCLIHKTFWVLF